MRNWSIIRSKRKMWEGEIRDIEKGCRGRLGMKSRIEDSTSTNEKNKIQRGRDGMDI